MDKNSSVPILIPFEPIEFSVQIPEIIRDDHIQKLHKEHSTKDNIMETSGLKEKPLYKIQEICTLFKVTKPTIYDWIKQGKLKRIKIRSRGLFYKQRYKTIDAVLV